MKYFAYGSNMSIRRLWERVPSARFVDVFELKSFVLKFHKVGRDGSAKCNAFFTDLDSDVVEGVVFEICSEEAAALDNAESYGYEKKNVQVFNASGEKLEAFTYIGTKINDSLFPFTWYKNHALIGAKSAALSLEYIVKIEMIKAIKDLDQAREQRELNIHEQ